jgi:hypothetical protein
MSGTDKFDLNALSEDERELYLSEKMKMFKLTVVICAFYGILAVILLVLALFTSWGQQFLYNEMFPFVITYIIGTIIIIIYLAYEVYTYEPIKTKGALGGDAEMCPDYWKIEYAGDQIKKKDNSGRSFLPEDVNKSLFTYKCVMDPNVFDKEKVKAIDSNLKYTSNLYGSNILYLAKELPAYDQITYKGYGLSQETEGKLFKEYSATMSGYSYTKTSDSVASHSDNAFLNISPLALATPYNSTITPLICDSVFPMYMAVKDNEYQIKNPDAPSNKFRCAYAKACNVSWTDAGCQN